jgi:hypothetical protein
VNERLEGVKGEVGERKGGARERRRRNKMNNNNDNNLLVENSTSKFDISRLLI